MNAELDLSHIIKSAVFVFLFFAFTPLTLGVSIYALFTVKDDVKNAPFVVDKFDKTKTKEILAGLKNILGNDLFELAIKKKSIRAGKGTMRGRKYKSNAGLLIVIGNGETLKFNSVDVKKANSVGVPDLARGGVGRLTLYTESAINELNERFKGK